MKISLEFDSCWQTSFLGDDEKKPISKIRNKINKPSNVGFMQKFVATSGTRGEKGTPIKLDTILGVLCRLIGDQRKLYQAQQSPNYYFKGIEDKISWNITKFDSVDELNYLTNMSDDRCAQSSWLGVLENDNPWFFWEKSYLLWSILFLDKDQLVDFILGGRSNRFHEKLSSPKHLIARLDLLSNSKCPEGMVIKTKERLIKDKLAEVEKKKDALLKFEEKVAAKLAKTESQKVKNEDKLNLLVEDLDLQMTQLEVLKTDEAVASFDEKLASLIDFLSNKFPDEKKRGEEYCKDGVIYPLSLYAAALYLQAEYLLEEGNEFSFLRNLKGEIQIQGFSKRGFNGVRDWLNAMSGGRKKAVGTPCIVQKCTGNLDIELRLDGETDKGVLFPDISRAEEIAKLIENAGVSSFYLGKKGLAYVSKIRI